jgi:hypothetical protein
MDIAQIAHHTNYLDMHTLTRFEHMHWFWPYKIQ